MSFLFTPVVKVLAVSKQMLFLIVVVIVEMLKEGFGSLVSGPANCSSRGMEHHPWNPSFHQPVVAILLHHTPKYVSN